MNVLARVSPPSRTETAPLVIRRVDAIPVALPLKSPMKMAAETITAAQNLLVRIEAADGTVGWGEAASAPTMTGDTQGGLVAAVRDHLAPLLVGKDARDWAALRKPMHRALVGNGGAHSAVEMALLDLIGRATGQRLIDLIAKPRRNAVKPMWLLGNPTAEADVAEAHAKLKEGFNFFKLKIGVKPLREGNRHRACGARGAAEDAALRRRQLRAHARRRQGLRREDPQGEADVRRAAARL